jgi:hypothetical protein
MTDSLLWLIRRVHQNYQNKTDMVVLMVDISTTLPNSSSNEVREIVKDSDLGIK